MSVTRFLTYAALASATFAQTIVVDGEEIDADETVVAPAAEEIVSSSSSATAALFADETIQLTDAVLANLTDLELSSIELFQFDDDSEATLARRSAFGNCKTAPGDALFPSELVWKVLSLLTGGAVQKTVPFASVCYHNFGNYDADECEYISNNWYNGSYIQAEDRTAINAILFENLTCVPPSLFSAGTGCEIGGYPLYSIDATTVSHIQLAVNLARNLNLRLVIKNTGHDFGAKSTGYGALSIWTHNLKSVKFYESYKQGSYKGPAFKMGSGVQAFEAYKAAFDNGVTIVGGEGQSVGVIGGFIQGGGHSPLSAIYGLACDQVLAFEVVTADGRFVTASAESNPDLFWSIRGGGGGTYGVVTSAIVKAHPKITAVSSINFSITSGTGNITDAMFWKALHSYWKRFPEFARDNANYEYFIIANIGTGYSFTMSPWFAPGMTVDELKELVAPMFAEWAELGIEVDPVYKQYDDFYPAWQGSFPLEPWGSSTIRQASRLFPYNNWDNDTIIQETLDVVKGTIEDGLYFIGFNTFTGVEGYPETAANPAWRTALLHGIAAAFWADDADEATKRAASDKLTFDWMEKWRAITPGSGAYMSESDYIEPNFTQSFWGASYDLALKMKEKWDPRELFYATNAVGSEKWELQKKIWGSLPSQNSKLCRA
ncbi:hypothetical protein EDB81DRAFT_918197 [Dactylonectria macrodidyma]|uniref:FAD-binding PCMH-type domain-containing protein n=1 Tax=Dactylonectria macrodidyma TaxID=307937 RepID=A0A9P9JG55_9HYPO|nr:hypothetical protein EDB81DRAFT_918197 [Dactylonectria macrodidyma]